MKQELTTLQALKANSTTSGADLAVERIPLEQGYRIAKATRAILELEKPGTKETL